jgi:hypothetical protein
MDLIATALSNLPNSVLGKYREGVTMTEADMDTSKKLDAYISLYKTQMEHFRNTVQIEWRVTFAAWTLLVALTYAVADKGIQLPGLAWTVLLVPILHTFWLCLIQGSEDVDKSLWVSYRRKALDILGCPATNTDSWTKRPVWKHAIWILLESGVTLLLSLVALSLLR